MDIEEFVRRTELFTKEHFGSLDDSRASLRDLINAHGDICEELAISQRKVLSWQVYFETLIHKLRFASLSICKLSEGILIESHKHRIKVQMIDYPSLCILTRAVLENYLTLDYIFYNNLPIEEKLFRFKLWEVSGLLSRQNFKKNNNKEFEQQKAKEKAQIDAIKAEIKKMPEYDKLDKRQISNLERFGLPRLESWNNLIQSSNLKKEFFGTTYSLLSNYAHSEFLSTIQFKQTGLGIDVSEVESFISTCFTIVRSLNSLSIEWLIENYEECNACFDELSPELQSNIKIWAGIGKE